MSQTLQPIDAQPVHRRFNSSVADGALPSIDVHLGGMGGGIGSHGPPALGSPVGLPGQGGASKFQPGSNTSRTISTLNTAQKQLVNFSVRAQNFILKKELQSQSTLGGEGGQVGRGRNNASKLGPLLDDSIAGLDPGASQNFSTLQTSPRHAGSAFQLPQIENAKTSPFKGFLDISIVTQKLRKNLASEGRRNNSAAVKGGTEAPTTGRGEAGGKEGKVALKAKFRGSSKPAGGGVTMSPKVLETWINETLQDAEHLDIPGVILKPEDKTPIQRYQIASQQLIVQGIPPDEVNRVYRGLFVYSVGFYELLNKCLQHTDKKYTVITALWKVFAILLEYCCRTDYRMLIQEISLEHQKEMEHQEAKYQAKFAEQANNEKIIKQNMEILQKYSETLEKERMNERQMRLKLEEEYAQNTRNHEEEVQLRLKFEKKLNEMHGEHRDLNTKYVRACKDLADYQEANKRLQDELDQKVAENTRLSQDLVENKSRMTNNVEKLRTLERDKDRQAQQLTEYDNRISKIQDELDLAQYKMQEQQKEISEMKLTTDVLTSDNDGLRGEKAHLTTDLKETRSLLRTYEEKTKSLMQELRDETAEHQELKRNMIGHNETKRELEGRIEKYKNELTELQDQYDQLQIKHGSLEIELQNVNEQLETYKKDLAETAERQHQTNKARHEFEIKAGEAEEKVKAQQAVIDDKEKLLQRKQQELEDLEKRYHTAQQQSEATDTKKQAIERQFELTKKQLGEKIGNLSEILAGEKETREMWIERYEKEQKEHQTTGALLMQSKSEYRDQMLATKNAEIKAQTLTRQVDILTQQNTKFQAQINEVMAKNELLDREVNTQKEIMRQFEQAKKEYVDRLKHELDTVEARFHKIINENNMVGEDYRSQAYINFQKYVAVKLQFTENLKKLTKAQTSINYYKKHEAGLQTRIDRNGMEHEDLAGQLLYKLEKIEALKAELAAKEEQDEKRLEEIEALKEQLRTAKDDLEQATDELQMTKDELEGEKTKEAEAKGPQMVDENISPIKFAEDQEKPVLAEAEAQTDIGMDYFDKAASDGSRHSQMSGTMSKSKSGRVPKSHVSRDSSLKDALNHDSSTAVGTLQHGQSKQMDSLDAGLRHNQSLEEGQSPGLRSGIAKEVIEEGEEEDQDEQDSSKVKKPADNKGFPSVMSGQGMRSGRTLNHEMSGSEMGTSSAQSPSYKSLMRSKNNQQNETFQDQLKQSRQQNSRRPAAASGIKKLLKNAIVNQ